MRPFFKRAYWLVALALAVATAAYAVVPERPRVDPINDVLNQVIVNYSSRAMLASKTTALLATLPTCPDTSSTSDTPVSALQYTTDWGWVQCTSEGWVPLQIKGRLTLDGGLVQAAALPTLSDGGVATGLRCVWSMTNSNFAAIDVPDFAGVVGTNFVSDGGGNGYLHYICE